MKRTFRLTATGLCAAACFALAAVTSCDGTDIPGADNTGMALRFAATGDESPVIRDGDGDAPQTRGTDYNKDNLPSLGVFASLTNGDFSSTATANYMYNQEVTRNGSTWTYSPVKYWPNNATDKLSFFAYAPRNAAGVTLPATNATGFPSLAYTVPGTEAAQTDLLVATPQMNRTYATASGNVSFSMKHALTKVVFRVKNAAGAAVSVSSFVMKGRTGGKLTFHNPTGGSSDKGFSWSNITGSATFTGKASTAAPVTVPVPATGSTEAPAVATFYLLPDGSVSTFSVTYTISGSSAKTVSDIALPSTSGWTAGAAVAYTMTIEPDNISVVTTTVSGAWGNGGSQNVTTSH